MKYVFFILIAFIAHACSDDMGAYNLESSVSPELLPYVLSFEEEAAARGMSIEWHQHDLIIELADIETEAVGRCLTFTDDTRRVEIDPTYWMGQTNIGKEFVVFHELGHCILDRGHLDEADRTGRCISIMHSSDDLCRNNYTARTREAFLDELFLHNQ